MQTSVFLPTADQHINGVVTPPAPRAEVWTITPTLACALLEQAHPNRPVSHVRVKTIARAITAGRWALNGETIVLCPDGRVLDGRHRLMAVVEADRDITTFVVLGIDPETFSTMDQGNKRTGGDVLSIEGHRQAKHLASSLRWLWRLEFEEMRSAVVAILDYELPEYLAHHPGLPKSLEWGKSVHALLPQGLGSALHYLMSAKDAALAKQIFYGLAQGQNLSAADAVWHVREKFLKDKTPLYHTAIVERAALVVQAWDCVRKGLPWVPGRVWKGAQDKTIAFPEIV